ncbi:autotransporter outer membrane beta-barrel domain-containing protein [Bordetella genomosp. 13]|uniref:autotransporter outer membrane beta-barrel domain-containing protein n=1 Tax=Bordetella genomosp. 13 TaxID=463040 RepID=UPI00119D1170|nr:autotransporter outer membrane beta-barrel domain-containing protein [Bordetella genomosp. 13]
MKKHAASHTLRKPMRKTVIASAISALAASTGAYACDGSGNNCDVELSNAVYTSAQGLNYQQPEGNKTGANGPGMTLNDNGKKVNLDPAHGGGTITAWQGALYLRTIGGNGKDEGNAGAGGAVSINGSGQVDLVLGSGHQTAAVLFGQSLGGNGSTDNDNNNSNGGRGGDGGAVVYEMSGSGLYRVAGQLTQDTSALYAHSGGGTGGHQNSSVFGDQVGGDGGNGGIVSIDSAATYVLRGDALGDMPAGALQIGGNSMVSVLRGESHGGAGGQYNGNAGSGGNVSANHHGGLLQVQGSATDGAGALVYGIRMRSSGATGFESKDDSDAGGTGGGAGFASVEVSSAIQIDVPQARGAAIYAVTVGGDGGKGPAGNVGGKGGTAGQAQVQLEANGNSSPYIISTTGQYMYGVQAGSKGGYGGDGGSSGGIVGQAGGGGYGGDAGKVSVSSVASANLITYGAYSSAISAWSLGGGGGSAGDFYDILGGGGGNGGRGGNASDVDVDAYGLIRTYGDYAIGIDAQSISGGGGAGGVAAGLGVQVGGDGGAAGSTGNVSVEHGGTIQTDGYGASGIVAMSVGGGGGNAGGAGGAIAVGGKPTQSVVNNGGTVTVANLGTIITKGDAAVGINAQSIGGGGGNAGGAVGIFAVGGQGETGGSGGSVTVSALGTIRTSGDYAYGVQAQSLGGGGGNGGSVLDVDVVTGFGIGGSGNAAGDGGLVKFEGTDAASITTAGINAHGILAQSIGGGGGSGGAVASGGINALTMSVGGNGAAGGNGGEVDFSWQNLNVATNGSAARGIMLQSIGGGGGSGGGVEADAISVGAQITANVGGNGSGGGNGQGVLLNLDWSTVITGSESSPTGDASALFAQSIGGGGGTGGNVRDQSAIVALPLEGAEVSVKVGVAMGGKGSGGGDGGNVGINATNSVLKTYGQSSNGIYAQSIGGGGGDGGSASIYSLAISAGEPAVNLQAEAAAGGSCNGDQCAGGHGGDVTVNLGRQDAADAIMMTIATAGDYGNGILAQSVGGGGGDGGSADVYAFAVGKNLNLTAKVGVGGKGGKGGDGGTVLANAYRDASISTTGSGARGIVAQSIGGGGGTAQGTSAYLGIGGQISETELPSASLEVAVGMTGGSGGKGGDATIDSASAIRTAGRDSDGILAQSIGGGGGVGGSMGADDGDFLDNVSNAVKFFKDRGEQFKQKIESGELNVQVGGSGGVGGDAGTATVDHTGSIWTTGDFADGIVVQSIGGGGGTGGASSAETTNTGIAGTLAIGGRGGVAGEGGRVNVTLGDRSWIRTEGDSAMGVLAQSVGGGGGQGGVSDVSNNAKITIGGDVGGSGGAASNGGTVTFTSLGANAIQTLGSESTGIVLQSIGGGGGLGGVSRNEGGATKNLSADIDVLIGGAGGAGGNGGAVNLCADGACSVTQVSTAGDRAMGVHVQSIGGGGGIASGGQESEGKIAPSVTLSLNSGGQGGDGGAGGNVTLGGAYDIDTAGGLATGVLAQSIGGGGGVATSASDESLVSFSDLTMNVSLGFFGDAAGGSAGTVSSSATGAITTAGALSAGWISQSIGGGGGVNGALFRKGVETTQATVNVGGTSSLGSGAGNTVSMTQSADIGTSGLHAYGVLAQSVGGGGGVGYAGIASAQAGGAYGVKVGGSAPAASNGGTVDVTALGTVTTAGAYSDGLVAQSVGGGGGMGAAMISADAAYTLNAAAGGVGAAGDGGTIGSADGPARYASHIKTSGSFANAVLLQSVGGGGGTAAAFTPAQDAGAATATLSVGGTGGSSGQGGSLAAFFDGDGASNRSDTSGYGAHAVVLQSVGGGGGVLESSLAGGSGSLAVGGSDATGAGGAVKLTQASWVPVTTQGANASGVILQSIGGGGGLATLGAPSAEAATGQYAVALGGAQYASGDGGAVTYDAGGVIQTYGDRSMGIVAQSIGGGGGIALAADAGMLRSATLGSTTAGSGRGGAVSVNASSGTVATTGLGSHAIVAQSIGGGGGILGDIGQSFRMDDASWRHAVADGAGNGGTVDVTVQGTATAQGANAHGVVAQSIGGGGGLGGAAQGGFAGTTANQGSASAGNVKVSIAGRVQASGADSSAIFAQSDAWGAKGTVAVDVSGQATGGTGSGAGVWIADGHDSKLTIAQTGTVSAASGTALRYDGNDRITIDNAGTLKGDVVCGGGACASNVINNAQTGTLADATLYQADVVNGGRVDIGRRARFDTLTVAGNYTQLTAGQLHAYVDFANRQASRMVVQGDARLDGLVDASSASLLPNREATVLTVQGTNTGRLQAYDSPIFDFDIRQAGRDYQYSVKGADFNAAGLGLARNQSRVADHLQRIWDAGANDRLAPLYSVLDTAARGGAAQYRARLSDLSPGATLAPAAQATAGMARFTSAMMSCPLLDAATLDGKEQDCIWGQVSSRSTDQDARQGFSGFTYDSTTYQVGGQREVSPGWFVGASAAYQNNRLRADDHRSNGKGDAGYAGVVLKRQEGPWVFAGALGGGYGSYSMDRNLGISGYEPGASSSPDVYTFGARLRAARNFQVSDRLYLKPYLDLDAMYTRMPGYTESGDALALKVDGSDQFVLGISPMLEIGGRVDLKKGAVLRPFAYAGASLLNRDSWKAKARLSGAPDGTGALHTELPTDSVVGRFGVGIEVTNANGLDFRLQYDAEAASHGTSQSGMLKVMYRY